MVEATDRRDASTCVSQSQARSAGLKIARDIACSAKYRQCEYYNIMLKPFKRYVYRLQTIEDLMLMLTLMLMSLL